jgi:pantoate--beta-alanine ligase
MKVIRSGAAMQREALRWKRAGRRVVLVPTMGALHAGHLALVRRARQLGNLVVVSVYVNPTQFGKNEDLARYPRPFARDVAACRTAGVDAVFAPHNLYAPDASTWVEETAESQGRCARTRPGHFRGVTTVVAKLFNLVLPDAAVFGWKDAQQCGVIRRMARDLDFPVRIVLAPTVRERDGLAMSSRNAYLTPGERQQAPGFVRVLRAAARRGGDRARWASTELAKSGFSVDYVEEAGGRLCGAVFLGRTRLIDNVPVAGKGRG